MRVVALVLTVWCLLSVAVGPLIGKLLRGAAVASAPDRFASPEGRPSAGDASSVAVAGVHTTKRSGADGVAARRALPVTDAVGEVGVHMRGSSPRGSTS